jgi:hypothetical protein
MSATNFFTGAGHVVLDGGTSLEWADIDLSSFVPGISRSVSIMVVVEDTLGDAEDLAHVASIREKGNTSEWKEIESQGTLSRAKFEIKTDTNQTIQYKVKAGKKAYVAVLEYEVTEI